MFRNRVRAAALLLAALLPLSVAGAAPARADADAAAQRLAGLQGWLDGTRELEADFEQELVSGAFGEGLSERGKLYLSRPGRMRWDYLDPERKVGLIVEGETLLYLEDDAQMYRGHLDADSDLLATLLAGGRPLVALFRPSLPGADSGDGTTLRLEPLQAVEGFEGILLRLRRRDSAIVSAEVLDPAGNRMLYRFSELRRNGGLPPGVFQFEPPPGTAIVDEE